MEFKIEHGPVFTIIRLLMRRGEQFRAESGAMIVSETDGNVHLQRLERNRSLPIVGVSGIVMS